MLINFNHLKTFYNALVQRIKSFRGNWNQNDPTADDYIKNRPFYSEGVQEVEVFPSRTLELDADYNNGILSSAFVEGQIYRVIWNNVEYECCAKNPGGGGIGIGNQAIAGWEFPGSITSNEPFFMFTYQEDGFLDSFIYPSKSGMYTISITALQEVVHKLDKKFIDIPDGIVTEDSLLPVLEDNLAPVAFTNDYNSLGGKPTIYTDAVRYGANQSLTTTQKTLARTNIGAASASDVSTLQSIKPVRYDAVQSLTDIQKMQARTNIGAGTGDYNDLENKPAYSVYTEAVDVFEYTYTSPIYDDKTDSAASPNYNPVYEANSPETDSADFIQLIEGEVYEVTFSGTTYDVIAKQYSYTAGLLALGNTSIYRNDGTDSGEPFFIKFGTNYAIPARYWYTLYTADTYESADVSIVKKGYTTYYPIDENLIPDTIARTSDINELKENGGMGYTEGEIVHTIDPKFLPNGPLELEGYFLNGIGHLRKISDSKDLTLEELAEALSAGVQIRFRNEIPLGIIFDFPIAALVTIGYGALGFLSEDENGNIVQGLYYTVEYTGDTT